MRVSILIPKADPADQPNLRALREYDALERAGHEPEIMNVAMLHYSYMSAPPMGRGQLLKRIAYHRATTRSLALWTIVGKPDLIIAHDIYTLSAGARAARKLGVPLLYDSHEDWPALIGEKSRIESLLAQWIENSAFGRQTIHHAFAPCQTIAGSLEKRLGVPATVLYNARATRDIVRTDRSVARAQLGFSNYDFVVGYIGAIEQLQKGNMFEVLFGAMVDAPSHVKLIVVGGPNEATDELRVRAKGMGLQDRIRIKNSRPFERLSPFYGALDLGLILLAPLRNYVVSLPNKLFDYMAFGVPVLAPDYPEIASVLRDTGAGWLLGGWEHPVTRMLTLSGMLDILSDLGTREAGERGRRAFLEKYAWDHQARRFVDICESSISVT